MGDSCLNFLECGMGADARRIAVRARNGAAPGVFWMGGFKSDMRGTKAEALDSWAAAQSRAYVRFDYSGHGESEGRFEDGTVGRWLAESLCVFERCCEGPQVVIGSSMGGWLALLLTRELKRRADARASVKASVTALVLIAPAPDFTERLMWEKFPAKIKEQIMAEGVWQRPSAYGEPYPITRALIEDGRRHLVLDGLIETGCPVRILQGVEDEDVPWSHAGELVSHLAHDDVILTLIKDGDHRLSRPEDIARLLKAVSEFTAA